MIFMFATSTTNAKSTKSQLQPRWIVKALTCIHHYEGAWNANTGNGYYGGLQMDWNFQKTYGRYFMNKYGTADHWPIRLQLRAGIRAVLDRGGFGSWPKTRFYCGVR